MRPWQPTRSADSDSAGDTSPITVDDVRMLREQFLDFMLGYKFAIDEITTKIDILREDFNSTHEYNPIEHVGSRLKTPESVMEKVQRKNYPMTLASIRDNILDIAGVRVVCSFISDITQIRDMLAGQADITVLEERDYITHRKPNGYQSLHLIVSIPVFRSHRTEHMPVEIQIRTIAMDFWASLEHKIYYKYRGEVPPNLRSDLAQAAEVATQLDEKMEALHRQVDRTERTRTGPADTLDLSRLYTSLVTDTPSSGLHTTGLHHSPEL